MAEGVRAELEESRLTRQAAAAALSCSSSLLPGMPRDNSRQACLLCMSVRDGNAARKSRGVERKPHPPESHERKEGRSSVKWRRQASERAS